MCLFSFYQNISTANPLTGMSTLISDQESEARKLRLEYMETILSYGENFVEIVCRDACTGHDITKVIICVILLCTILF